MHTGIVRSAVLTGLLLSVTCMAVQSTSLYKWVDADGNVTYQDEPPPENVSYEKTDLVEPVSEVSDDLGLSIEEAARENPVSLYTIPICDVCDLVRQYLERRSIPFAEKNVQSSPARQEELQSLTGQLSVPVLAVGDSVLDGYSKTAIRDLLGQKGFPIEQIEENLASASAGQDSQDSDSGGSEATASGQTD